MWTLQCIYTCLLREPLRSESAKSQIYEDTRSLRINYHKYNQQTQQRSHAAALIWLFAHFAEDQVSQARTLRQ